MPNFKIIQNEESISPCKYTIVCNKCKNEFLINHLFFCSYECSVCKKKMMNPNHKGYHSRKKCFYKDVELTCP